MFRLVLLFVLTAASIQFAYCCTSLCVSANATDTRHAFVTYNADDSTGYGYARFFPAGTHLSGSRRKIVDGDSRVLHGDIPEAEETFNVVHRANEHGVAIGESTWEGLKELQTPFPGSILDYESLIDLALQRATNAIEAAGVITGLAELYGWVSLGESFSIADKKHTIILEVIGKGKFGRGVVWILRFIPQGTVTAHANQPRITTCPAEDCLMHPDTIPLARQLGYSGTDEDFSFSDFFQPLDPATVRACEARVWSAFQKLTNGGMNEYLDYAKGWDLTKRMPLYVVPAFPVTRQMLFDIMRDTYGGTFFAFNDTDQYVGAGPYSAPYRSRPLEFNYEGHTYVNERPIGTQQTLTSQIAEIRTDESIPRAFRTVVWFSVDDTVLSVRLPIYTGVSAVPPSFSFNSGDVMKFSLQSAFWAFNLVANLSYTAFSYIAPIVQNEVQTIEAAHEKILAEMDDTLRSDDSGKAIDTVSRKIVELGENLTAHWIQLWQQLFMEYKDTYILKSVPGQWQPEAGFQEVPQSWYARVVKESGNRFLIPSSKIKEPKKQD